MKTYYKQIAVGIDFSEQSLQAFQRAIKVAKQNEAALHIVSVVDTHSFGSVQAYDMTYAEQVKGEREKQIQALKEEAIAAGVEAVHVVVELGSPKAILSNLKEIDLVIISATGLNRFEKMIIGSNAERIVRNAKCDVLVVRG
ncbi:MULTISPECIES: universal stress protein [Bacillales]|uniref:Universal stress protein n=1 Tax=Lysinibacillus louembei TaxID=1470088 RepID=A0ABZ0RXE5_9BACI|nr:MULTISPECIES: universal stress protein [Bacillales]MCT6922628.1 universal stress protein [Metasolibacillus sp.]MCT6939033.1 universal stress protein [Metasolibacillus sp.]WPK11480.1 universal stress protein [Lysinibacillus louembei]